MLAMIFTLIAIVLVVMFAARFFADDRGQNRYKRRRTAAKPPSCTPEDAAASQSTEDSDAILGIKPMPKKKSADRLLTLYLLPDQGLAFQGYELLQALLTCDLRFNEQKIFQRENSDDKQVLFRIAQLAEPGIFDLNDMSKQDFPGLVFIMQVDRLSHPDSAIKQMVDCAWQLQSRLGGEVLDQQHEPLTSEKIAALYQVPQSEPETYATT